MTLPSTIFQFLVAATVVVVAGTVVTRFADDIAVITGLSRLLVGSVLLAAATSAPELFVDLSAIRLGSPDLAVGDLFGASLFNLLILAALDLSRKAHGGLLSHAPSGQILSATMSVVLTAMAAIGILADGRWPFAIGGIDMGCLAIVVVFLLGVRLVFNDQGLSSGRVVHAAGIAFEPHRRSRSPLLKAATGFMLATSAIVVAAPYMARSADRLAWMSGLGGSFVGTTLVACCTTLPELVSSIAAVRMGALDLAAGNIFGSNCFNMAVLVPLDMAHPGPLLASVSPAHAVTCLATIIVTGTVIAGQVYRPPRRLRLVEPDAVLIILLVIGSMMAVYAMTVSSSR